MALLLQEFELLIEDRPLGVCTNPDISKKEIVQEIRKIGYKVRTIYNNIQRITETQKIQDLPRSGRKQKITPKIQRKIINAAKHRIGQSLRKLGQKLAVHHSTIRKVLMDSGYSYYKRQHKPKYSDKQLEIIPKRALKLYRSFLKPNTICIMDDEKYFTLSGNKIKQNSGYYSKDKSLVSPKVKYHLQTKFEKKVLVWIAISSNGLSSPYIQENRNEAISKKVYLERCLQPNLVKFISDFHKNTDLIFWPDLASSHYSKDVINWLESQNIKFVPKECNPPNCPQVRPIETFWAILEQMVYKDGWEAKTCKALAQRIRKCIKNFDKNLCKRLMDGLRSKVRILAREGPYSLNFD
jgi:transposase